MRIIGYFTSWNKEIKIENLKYEYLTHINYAFLVPKEDGNFVNFNKKEINKLIDNAHKHNVKVFISVGGWSYNNNKLDRIFEKICANKKTLNLFISNILSIVKEFNFDGVDMDWEYPTKKHSKQYEYMITSLKEGLCENKKELSIAIPPGINVDNTITNVDAITNKVLETVDWINLMAYDNILEENHSSYEYAIISVEYWLNNRKYSKDKIVLGLPFYSRPSNIIYREIVNYDIKNYKYDRYKDEFYNGVQTIKKKTQFAKERCSGVMIWALNYDTLDEYSLLKCVYENLFESLIK